MSHPRAYSAVRGTRPPMLRRSHPPLSIRPPRLNLLATPDVDFQRVDASGRNAGFRWTTPDGAHTLSFTRPPEGSLAIDYQVESLP